MADNKKHIVIVTDAWEPQVNGVVNTLQHIKKQMEARGHVVDVIWPDPKIYENLHIPGYKEIPIAWRTRNRRLSVEAQLKELDPDYIYIATEGPIGYRAAFYCYDNGIPYTTGYHTKLNDYVENYAKNSYLSWLAPTVKELVEWGLRRFHSTSEFILAPTASVREELIARGYDKNKVIEWTRGVDTNLFRPLGPNEHSIYENLNGVNYKAKGRIWLNVGRVAPEKNLEAFLDLDLPGTKVIVGGGDDYYLELRKKYGKRPDVVFAGEKKGEELAQYYRGADVFVFPSKSDTFGNVQLEALASGVPIAAYPVPGPQDIITKEGIIGYLNKDLRIACLKAEELVSSEAKKNATAEACVQYVKKNYTWQKAADIFEKHLVDLMHAKGPPLPEVTIQDRKIARSLLGRIKRFTDSQLAPDLAQILKEMAKAEGGDPQPVSHCEYEVRYTMPRSRDGVYHIPLGSGLTLTDKELLKWLKKFGLSNGGYSSEDSLEIILGFQREMGFAINSKYRLKLIAEDKSRHMGTSLTA